MSWGCEAAVSLQINGNNILESIEAQEILLYASELADNEISLSTKVKKPLFFDEFKWYLSLTKKSKKYHSDFSSIKLHLILENYMGSPIDVLEMLLFTQYLSTQKTEDTITIGVGDMSVVWLDLEFKKGACTNVNVTIDGDINEPTDAFNCTAQEMKEFFSISILDRLNSIKPQKKLKTINMTSNSLKNKPWTSGEGLSIRINEIFIKELIEEKEILLFVNELANQKISLETKLQNPIFFEMLYPCITPTQKIENYCSNFSSVIKTINKGGVDTPIEALEVLLFSQYLSTKKPDDKIKVFLGDSFAIALTIEFENGVATNINIKDIFGKGADIGSFNCSTEEMTGFFSVHINDRMNK